MQTVYFHFPGCNLFFFRAVHSERTHTNMKKIFAIMMAVLTVAAMAIGVSAVHITTFADAEVIDNPDTNDVGGSGNPIQLMEAYGCGYSSKGDQVVFHDVDFGAYGAESASMHFGFGGDGVSNLAFYIDGVEALKFDVGNTGGWDIASSGWVDLPLAVPAGIHTITCEFIGDASGSLSELKFNIAYPDAYLELATFTDAEVIDNADSNSVGGSGNPIQLMEAYGCGYSSKGDQVIFNDVDFGANGAAGAIMHFGYAGDSVTNLAFYIDGVEALKIDVGNTGGWDIANSGWVDLPLAVPAGIHTITCEFIGDASGSLSEISFFEAEPAPVVEDVAGAPATFDAGVIAAVAAIISAAGYAVSKKH